MDFMSLPLWVAYISILKKEMNVKFGLYLRKQTPETLFACDKMRTSFYSFTVRICRLFIR